jgi:hypothetical protein
MLGVLVAGAVIGAAGLLAIGFGIPVKEFSLGNMLIISGVVAACSGALLIAAAMILRELRAIGRALGPATATTIGFRQHQEHGDALSAQRAALAVPSGFEPVARQDEPSPPPWQAEDASAAQQASTEQSAAPSPTAAPAKKRRNLLFMSSRRDRPPASAEPEEAAGSEGSQSIEAAPAPTVSFEDAWPAAERQRSEAARQFASRSGEGGEARAAAPPPVRRPAEAPPVTILKSGVVDGMAYSLYSDGSIEAQLPEGMIRFASIDELRNHLDQRG